MDWNIELFASAELDLGGCKQPATLLLKAANMLLWLQWLSSKRI